MDNYNLASLCYKWIERYEKIVKERDQAIKERDVAFRSADAWMRDTINAESVIKLACKERDVERLAHKADNNEAKRMIDEARMWASKMMAERDEYKKLYDELWVRHNLCLDR
jgi:hypothetical protein